MDSVEIGGNLVMNKAAEFERVNLVGGKIVGQVSLILSRFNQKLNMNSLEVKDSLFLDSRSNEWIEVGVGQRVRGSRGKFAEVDLVGAKIGSQLTLNRSLFEDVINMDSITVQHQVLMNDGATFAGVNLHSAKIGGALAMLGSLFKKPVAEKSDDVFDRPPAKRDPEFSVNLASASVFDNIDIGRGSTFEGKLSLNSIKVTKNLFMTLARFTDVDLIDAKIDGHLHMTNSVFNGKLDMQLVKVNGDVFMPHVQVKTPMVPMNGMKIGGDLNLSGGTFPSINLTNTSVAGEFSLGQKNDNGIFPAKWNKGADLILRNTRVGFLQDLPESWPDNLELTGFTYSYLGGLTSETDNEMARRDATWFRNWLAKQKKYTPDVYEQLANVLTRLGYKQKAIDILYAGKERERSEAQGWNRVWLNTLHWVIGYGLGNRIWWVLYSVGIWVFIGAVVIFFFEGQVSMEERERSYGFPYILAIFIYSAVMLIPLIKLNSQDEIVKSKGVSYYFYLHQLIGYVLTSFIIAGLAGITK